MPGRSRRSASRARSGASRDSSFRPGVGQSAQRGGGQRRGGGLFGGLFGKAAEEQAVDPAWQAVLEGSTLLRQGSRGPAVEILQELLVDSGAQITVDGDFGPATRRAVVAAQRALGESPDGVVGPKTAGKLEGGTARLAQPAPREQRPDRGGDQRGDMQSAGQGLDAVKVRAGDFANTGLRPRVLGMALEAFRKAFESGQTEKLKLTVIDYELHSSEKRFWVIDLARRELLFHEYTTHGSGSDRNHDGRADRMSNVSESGTSNVGVLRTAETYYGKHGLSLRMDGMERGFNDNARDRAVVIHSASYADDRYIERNGKAGRSLGCPALDPDVSGDIIQEIKGGTIVFAYYPDENWLRQSQYVN